MQRFILAGVLALGSAAHASAQTEPPTAAEAGIRSTSTLAIGDAAPPFLVEKFLTGEPLAGFEKGKVYAVEFWATWCAPCIEAIPHLSALQAEYRDRGVRIVSVNIREMRRFGEGWVEALDEGTRANVESFVQKQGDRMAYTVAYDGAAKAMDRAWMTASGSEALPTAFVVDRAGKIAWIGHPMVLRMPLHELVEGSWNPSIEPDRVKRAENAYLDAMRLFTTDAKAGLDAWEKAAKKYPILAEDLVGPKFDALVAAGQWEAACATGEALFVRAAKIRDASALNRLAWSIVDPNGKVPSRNLDLAWRAARSANEATKGADPGILDTLARVHFCKGEIPEAIELQERAVQLADEPMKARLTPALEEYRKAKD